MCRLLISTSFKGEAGPFDGREACGRRYMQRSNGHLGPIKPFPGALHVQLAVRREPIRPIKGQVAEEQHATSVRTPPYHHKVLPPYHIMVLDALSIP